MFGSQLGELVGGDISFGQPQDDIAQLARESACGQGGTHLLRPLLSAILGVAEEGLTENGIVLRAGE